ncbi:KEKE-like motif-containing transcription regulator (Rlr1)/suppressor of sin4 [Phaffia rhodozyma]|uniref:THO complex subunit 2 n=1 Tax=Phaffia rhodozyma TaxID=264483 RepID=A0A0F7SYD8_PHARH|nr:KEKE-like motif-containing transcription regulator (Rlr1)/suppressor of sin4 [Phaffia rhodozyma]
MASVSFRSAFEQALESYRSSLDDTLVLSIYHQSSADPTALQYFFHLVLRAYSSISLASFLPLLQKILSSSTQKFGLEPTYHFADALCFLDAEIDDAVTSDPTQVLQREKDVRTPWLEFCKAVFHHGLLNEQVWDRFDFPFFDRLGLLGSGLRAATSRTTRKSTVTFFSLKKFNLLRESSEGFSLILVLVNTPENLGPGKDPNTAIDIESPQKRAQRARSLWNKIMSVIGYFDLDPSKTVDLILDAFATHLVTHHRFFLDLLRSSPWAPPPISPPSTPSASGTLSTTIGEKELRGESGSSVLAQVLGFKFGYYQDQDVIRSGERLPDYYYLMAAVLIKEGFMKLTDFWVHLSPDEPEMNKYDTRYRQAVNELARASKGNAMLASAAPLLDDDDTSSISALPGTKTNGTATPLNLPLLPLPQQKIDLVESLMAVGARPEVDYLTTRFGSLVVSEPRLVDLQLRLIRYRLQDLLPSNGGRAKEWVAKPRTAKLTGTAPTPLQTKTEQFVWFYPEWTEGVDKIENLEMFFATEGIERELRVLGGLVGRHMGLLTGICRLGVQDVISNVTDEKILDRWAILIRLVFLPSLSLSGGSATSQEIWSLLSLYPLETRFGIYGAWKASYQTNLQLKVQGALAERDAKSALRRVSKDDLKFHARALGKLSHSDPIVTWSVALRQVQSYDNLVKPLVESARYLTPLGADVVVFMLLDAFSNPDKDRTKTDGTSTSLWLKSLAAFAGELCRRHHSMIDCTPILHYIANQLRAGNTKDLIILRELISAMTSIEPLANLSDNQVSAQGGGPTLRQEVIHPTVTLLKPPLLPGQDPPRPEAPVEKKALTGKSTIRLIKSLKDSGLLIPLLVVVAQTRDGCMFNVPEVEAHMKHLSSLFDNATEVLLQLVELLQQHLSAEEYANVIPPFADLVETYRISPALAFHILRPKLAFNIKKYDTEKAKKAALEAAAETPAAKEARLKLALNSKRSGAAADSSEGNAGEKTGSNIKSEGKYHPALKDTITSAVKYLPQDTKPTSPFFVTFWQLTPYDIEVPLGSYQTEIDRLNRAEKDLGRFPTSAQTSEWQREREKLRSKAKQLQTERDQQMEAYAVTKRRLAIEKNVWFRKNNDPKGLNQHIFQHCIFPRAMLSLSDAAYCAKFIKVMHNMGTCNFSSLWLYNLQIINEWLPPLVSSFTENEARNFAHFLYGCLDELTQWHVDEKRYIKEAVGDKDVLPGFLSAPSRPQTAAPIDIKAVLPWDGYRKVMHKWHIRLLTAFELCIASTEYSHIKNIVIVLQKVLPFFPRDIAHGEAMEVRIKQAISEEKREDLKLLLQSYSSQLSKLKKAWIPQSQFLNLSFSAVKGKLTTSEPASPAHSNASVSALPAAVANSSAAANSSENSEATDSAMAPVSSSASDSVTSSGKPVPTAPKSESRGSLPHLNNPTSRVASPGPGVSSATSESGTSVDKGLPSRLRGSDPVRPPSAPSGSSSTDRPSSNGSSASASIQPPTRPAGLKGLPMNPSRLRTSIPAETSSISTSSSNSATPSGPGSGPYVRPKSPPRGPKNQDLVTGPMSAEAKAEAKEAREQDLARERTRMKEIREKELEKEDKRLKDREKERVDRDRLRERDRKDVGRSERDNKPRESHRDKERDRRGEPDRDGKRRRGDRENSPDNKRRRGSSRPRSPIPRARSPLSSRDNRSSRDGRDSDIRDGKDRDSGRRFRIDSENSNSRTSGRRSTSPATSVQSNGRERRDKDDRDGRSRENDRSKSLSSRIQDRSDRDRDNRNRDRDHGRADREKDANKDRNEREKEREKRFSQPRDDRRSRDVTPKFDSGPPASGSTLGTAQAGSSEPYAGRPSSIPAKPDFALSATAAVFVPSDSNANENGNGNEAEVPQDSRSASDSRKREREELSSTNDQPIKKRITRGHRYGLDAALNAATKGQKRR